MKEFDRFEQAAGYRATEGRQIDLVVLHSTENETGEGVAAAVARWFAREESGVSAHYVVGPDEAIKCVLEKHVAWAAPGANHNGVQIELVGFARYTELEWGGPGQQAMMVRAAWLTACICLRYRIPIEVLEAEALTRGGRGITTHASVSKAFRKSSHWDPGPEFPIPGFMGLVEGMKRWKLRRMLEGTILG